MFKQGDRIIGIDGSFKDETGVIYDYVYYIKLLNRRMLYYNSGIIKNLKNGKLFLILFDNKIFRIGTIFSPFYIVLPTSIKKI